MTTLTGYYFNVDAERARTVDQARAAFDEIPTKNLERRGPYWVDTRDGTLWRVEHGVPYGGYQPDVHRIVVQGDQVTYLRRPAGKLRTLTDLEGNERANVEAAALAEQERQQRLAQLRKGPQVAITYAQVTGTPPLTLKAAADLIESVGGVVKANGPTLIITVPERCAGFPGLGMAPAFQAADVLHRASRLVAGLLTERKPLPDRHIEPSGNLI
jgi:hypothetical protein